MSSKVTKLEIGTIRQQAREGNTIPPAVALKLCGEVERLNKLLDEVRREQLERGAA